MASFGDLALRNPTTGIAGCCARAANGNAAASLIPAFSPRECANYFSHAGYGAT